MKCAFMQTLKYSTLSVIFFFFFFFTTLIHALLSTYKTLDNLTKHICITWKVIVFDK